MNASKMSYCHLLRHFALMVSLFSWFSATSLKGSEAEGSSNDGVQICLVAFGEKVYVSIRNHMDSDMKFSRLMSYGNAIYLSGPDNQIKTYLIENKRGANFEYKPDFVLGSKEHLLFEVGRGCEFTAGLHRILERLNDPGDYEVWFDVVDHVDFQAGKSRKFSSNRLGVHLDEGGSRNYSNDARALEFFRDLDFKPVAKEVQVYLHAELGEVNPVFHVLISNESDDKLKLWDIGKRSLICLRVPDGGLLTYGIQDQLPDQAENGPDEIVPASSFAYFNSKDDEFIGMLEPVINGLVEDGDYEIWLEFYDYPDSEEKTYEQFKSNRLKFHFNGDGLISITSDPKVIEVFRANGVSLEEVQRGNWLTIMIVSVAAGFVFLLMAYLIRKFMVRRTES